MVLYPIKLTTSVPLEGALILKLPSKSVLVATFVPFTAIVAPGTKSPFSSTTFPFTMAS